LVVVVHDADAHSGDGFAGQMVLQRLLCLCAGGLAVLCGHVGTRLRQQGLAGTRRRKLIPFEHPPFAFGMPAIEPAPRRAEGPHRLLFFGRLLPYKGLDLLAGALATLPPDASIAVRVVGRGPESQALDALRACRGVTVENRWVPETEIGALLAWSDALILPYREASQSGVAAAALAAGLPVIATRVGGLTEQLSCAPQAVLCEAAADSLARAISLWLERSTQIISPVDVATAWRRAVTDLVLAIGTAQPAPDRKEPNPGFVRLEVARVPAAGSTKRQ
jgi:glycosyltransferase involved in cell wall biosynthesis